MRGLAVKIAVFVVAVASVKHDRVVYVGVLNLNPSADIRISGVKGIKLGQHALGVVDVAVNLNKRLACLIQAPQGAEQFLVFEGLEYTEIKD